MTATTALIRSSLDHWTRPRFIENAAMIQYSQNAAQRPAKVNSITRIVDQPVTARNRSGLDTGFPS